VYVLLCADGSLYTGCTNDLERRVAAHNAGKGARYTRARRPVSVAWSRRVKDRSRALSLEARLKQLTRVEKLAVIAGASV
jgi:putative endonuclease